MPQATIERKSRDQDVCTAFASKQEIQKQLIEKVIKRKIPIIPRIS